MKRTCTEYINNSYNYTRNGRNLWEIPISLFRRIMRKRAKMYDSSLLTIN